MRKFDDLLVFVRVVERGSFVGAARQLELPPTTVSRKIHELEERLGSQLLRRSTRKLSVTETGQSVYEAAARGFASIEEAEALAVDHHLAPSGTVRIILPHAFAQLRFEPFLAEFRDLYPKVRLDLLVTDLPLDLLEYGADIAIRAGTLLDSSYLVRSLGTSRHTVIANADYLDRSGRPQTPTDLLQHAIAAKSGGTSHTSLPEPFTYTFTKDDRREPIRFEPSFISNEPMSLMTFATQGAGVAIMLETLCSLSLRTNALEVLLPDWEIEEKAQLNLIYTRRATMDLKVKVMIDFLVRITHNT